MRGENEHQLFSFFDVCISNLSSYHYLGDAQPAEPRSGWAGDPPEERAVELARTLSSRRYLDGGSETEDVAALLVEVAGSFSLHTSVRYFM